MYQLHCGFEVMVSADVPLDDLVEIILRSQMSLISERPLLDPSSSKEFKGGAACGFLKTADCLLVDPRDGLWIESYCRYLFI